MAEQLNSNQPGRNKKPAVIESNDIGDEVNLSPHKRTVGRPTKYNPEFCQQIIDFFNQKPYEDIEIPHYKDGQISWKDFKRVPQKLPTIVEFSNSIGVCYATVYDWIDKKNGSYRPDFLQAFTRAKKAQENFLIQNGLQGLYNPLFAKFVALNITDMKDTAIVDNSKHYHITYGYRKSKSTDSTLRSERRPGQFAESDTE